MPQPPQPPGPPTVPETPAPGSPAERSSLDEIIELYKRDVDRTLLREQLRKTPDQRVRELVELERFADELRRAGRKAFR
jgi:hypothetical protein